MPLVKSLLQRAALLLIEDNPFYASILLQLRRIEGEAGNALCPTACVALCNDASIAIAVNEPWFSALPDKQQLGVIMHECLHVIFMHVYYDQNDFEDKRLMGIAADLVINQHIPRDTLPEDGCFIDESPFAALNLEPKQTLRYYYDALKQAQDNGKLPKPQQIIIMVNGAAGGDPDDAQGQSGSTMDDHSNWGKAIDAKTGEEVEISPEIAKAAIRSIIEQAKADAKRTNSWGNVPGGIKDMIEAALAPQVNWRQQIRIFAGERIRVDKRSTRKRPNRRYGWGMPGYVVKRRARLLVAIDTSGSISRTDLSQFAAELGSLAQQVEIVGMDVDYHVQTVYQIRHKRDVPTEFKGRGGTSFRVVWQTLADSSALGRKERRLLQGGFDGIIYLTDGYADFPTQSKIPTLWVMTTNVQPPFGKVARIDVKD